MSQKSKEKITDTLLHLMDGNSFYDITISVVCTCADIARKTFYNHFSSKEDVITTACGEIIQGYIHMDFENEKYWLKELAVQFFSVNQQQQVFIGKLIHHNLFHLYGNELHRQGKLHPFVIAKHNINELPEDLVNYMIPTHVACALKLYEIWYQMDFAKSPEEITEIYFDMIYNKHSYSYWEIST